MAEPADPIKRMDIAEFRQLGYLQEVNRLFLHPLGLALEVVVDADGTEWLGGIWDYRNDPEGIAFGPGAIDLGKAQYIRDEHVIRMSARRELLGYWQQPISEATDG